MYSLFLTKSLFVALALFCLSPWVNAAGALVMGIAFAVALGNPFLARTQKLSKHLLALSIIGLGAGINLSVIFEVGAKGIIYASLSIVFTLIIGLALGRFLKVQNNIAALITFGTAICGGSAIAAAAPVLRAKEHEIAVSMGVVFALNALALVIFPHLGHALGLTQEQFGLWAALAIHDTSSVVGASLQYGEQALEVGLSVKLIRALWILPLMMALGVYMARRDDCANAQKAKLKLPWFILGFIIMSAIFTFVSATEWAVYSPLVVESAKRLLNLTLFLIGAGLSVAALKQVGVRPLMYGAALWGVISMASLFLISVKQF